MQIYEAHLKSKVPFSSTRAAEHGFETKLVGNLMFEFENTLLKSGEWSMRQKILVCKHGATRAHARAVFDYPKNLTLFDTECKKVLG